MFGYNQSNIEVSDYLKLQFPIFPTRFENTLLERKGIGKLKQ